MTGRQGISPAPWGGWDCLAGMPLTAPRSWLQHREARKRSAPALLCSVDCVYAKGLPQHVSPACVPSYEPLSLVNALRPQQDDVAIVDELLTSWHPCAAAVMVG